MAKIKLAGDDCSDDAVGDRVVGADDVVASEHQKVKPHHHDVDCDDDGGHGGGPEHSLGAKRLQDAEASLAGYDGRQDLGNAAEPVKTKQVVVRHERKHGAVSDQVGDGKKKMRVNLNWRTDWQLDQRTCSHAHRLSNTEIYVH